MIAMTRLLALTLLLMSSMAFGAPGSQSVYRAATSVDNIHKTQDIGLGLALGTANGVTGKYWTSEEVAVDTQISFAPNNLAVSADYLYHFRYAAEELTGDLGAKAIVPYGGLGLIAAFGTGTSAFFNTSNSGTTTLGIKIPLGVEYLAQTSPLGFFAEINPGIGFSPANFGFFQADIGGRYYF